MGALKLCTYKKAEYPLYLEMLSLHVYTMEELCYAMESSLFLLDESWMGTEFFQWIAEGVGNAELAGQLRRLYQRHSGISFLPDSNPLSSFCVPWSSFPSFFQ